MQEAIDLTGVESQQYTKKPQQDVGAFSYIAEYSLSLLKLYREHQIS